MKAFREPSLIAIVVYDGVEPIDVAGTAGVISMASRILPALRFTLVAERVGPVSLASGLTVLADADFETCLDYDACIVTGGPGWREQAQNPAMIRFLGMSQSPLASVCTGALILAAAGRLDGKTATTRRHAIGEEPEAPIELLRQTAGLLATTASAVVDDHGTVTSGGVSLAIDGTLYILGRIYGTAARDEIARLMEYDRAFFANQVSLGHVSVGG